SQPRERNADARFDNAGAYIQGGYSPGPAPHFYPTELNVAFAPSPPPTVLSPPVDGYVARVAIDVSAITVPGGPFPNSAYRAYTLGEEPTGWSPVLVSIGGKADLGTVNATFDVPNATGLNWGIFVPEPTPVALIALAGVAMLRRRHICLQEDTMRYGMA